MCLHFHNRDVKVFIACIQLFLAVMSHYRSSRGIDLPGKSFFSLFLLPYFWGTHLVPFVSQNPLTLTSVAINVPRKNSLLQSTELKLTFHMHRKKYMTHIEVSF